MIAAIRALRAYVHPYRRSLGVGALLAVVEVLANLAQPWPLGFVVDHVLAVDVRPDSPDRLLALAAIGFFVVVGLGALCDYWSTRLLSSSGLHLANDVRDDVFAQLHRLELGFHRRHQIGDLSSRVTADVDRTQDMLVQTLAVLVPNTLLVVGMFAVMCVVSVELTLVALVVSPVLVLAVHRTSRSLRQATRVARKADGQVAAATTESLSAMQTVQVYSLEAEQQRRFTHLTGASLAAGLESVRHQARFSPVVDSASAVSTVSVLWLGGHRVLDGDMRLGVLLVFLSYLGSLYKPIKQLTKLGTVTAKGAAAAERVIEVLAEQPTIVDRPYSRVLPRVEGRIGLHGVSFSYGRERVLEDVSLVVEAGEQVALVGPTGAGKSTIAALVSRLVDPVSGWVSIDGHDLRGITIGSLRAQVSMVLQDTVLLRGTIRDNIAWGRPWATEAQIRRAASLSLIDEFAGRLPQGLDTPVGERGVELSGGQRQRIAIARAILRDAPVLVLDEPTSALDPTSEAALVEALDNLPTARTRLVIAHRLTTIRRADRIAVLQGGRIVECGSHHELLQQRGKYSQMHHAGDLVATPRPLWEVAR